MKIDLNDKDKLRELIMEHYSSPKHKGFSGDGVIKEIKSSTCSDKISFEINFDGERIKSARFSGEGCAVSLASSDVMCEIILGKSKSELKNIIAEYNKMLSGSDFDIDIIDKLAIFSQIVRQKNRIKCASIPIEILQLFL